MSDARERTLGETLNTWVQIIGIIVAAVWGGYTFVYKEIKVPQSAPINITMNLQLKKVGTGNVKKPLVAVEMHVSATNPSSRKVYLLPGAWIVYGFKIAPADENPDSLNKRAGALMSAQEGEYVLRHAEVVASAVVAAGSLFPDQVLNPSETLTRTIIFYVPRHEYDRISAVTLMPSAEVDHRFELQWTVDEETDELVPAMYLIGAGGKRTPMKKEKGQMFPTDKRLRSSASSSQLSLWE